MMRHHPKASRHSVILWAYRSPISGNSQSVDAARRCLLYLASVCNLYEHAYLLAWRGHKEIAEATGLLERTTQRAIKRLVDAGLVKRVHRGRYACFSILYPTKPS